MPSKKPSRPTKTPRQDGGKTTTAQGEVQQPVPQAPYERDESVGPQGAREPSVQRVGELAHADTQRSVPDTSRGAEMDATYHRLREDARRDGLEGSQREAVRTPAPRASRR